MATKQRPVDVGTETARRASIRIGSEIRQARLDRGLTLAEVGRAVGLSGAQISRIERALAGSVTVLQLARLLAMVGLELSASAYPGGQPLRDAAQVALLARFHALLHRTLRWATEVPLPQPGDQRAWDAVVALGSEWRYGIEAETSPRDSQALARRLALKQRDGQVDGVILVLPATRRSRDFVRAAGETLWPNFPVDGGRALELLHAGVDPGGSSVILI